MTTQEIIIYYSNLLIFQYRGKPRAYATIQALVNPVIMDQLPIAVQNAFDIETAVGVQLDVLGKYIGVSRNQYDFNGPITLGDEDYRLLLKIQIIQNSSESSLAAIQDLLHRYFDGVIQVYDYRDMSMAYTIDESVGDVTLAEVFVKGGFLPKPMAVLLRATIIIPTAKKYFGFRTYYAANPEASPYNTYADYEMDRPFLSYKDAVIP